MNLSGSSIKKKWLLCSKVTISAVGIRSAIHRVAVGEQIGSCAPAMINGGPNLSPQVGPGSILGRGELTTKSLPDLARTLACVCGSSEPDGALNPRSAAPAFAELSRQAEYPTQRFPAALSKAASHRRGYGKG
jgi:hypothetical protein